MRRCRPALGAIVAVLCAACARHEYLLFDEGGAGTCLVTTSLLEFDAAAGCSAEQLLSLRNVGDGPLEVVVPGSAGNGAFRLVGAGAIVLEAGQQRNVRVLFEPTATGSVTANLSIAGGCRTVQLQGTATSPPACVVGASSLDFGTFAGGTACPQRTFTIRNTGAGLLSGSVTSPCGDFLVIGGGDYSLTTGQQTTVTIQYAPRHIGSAACEIDVGAPCFCTNVAVTGNATATADGLVTSDTGATLAFGTVLADGGAGDSETVGFSIRNVGDFTISVDPEFSPSAPDFLIVDGGPRGLFPGGETRYTARFNPLSQISSFRDWSIVIVGLGGCALPVTARGTTGFAQHVGPRLSASCIGCHDGSPAVVHTFGGAIAQVDAGNPSNSRLLIKATGGLAHGGGAVWSVGDTDYQHTLIWIQQGTLP